MTKYKVNVHETSPALGLTIWSIIMLLVCLHEGRWGITLIGSYISAYQNEISSLVSS